MILKDVAKALLFLLFCADAHVVRAATERSASDGDYRGRTMVVFGDSYVRNHRRPYSEAWHARVAERLGMNYRNYGRNGSSIAFDRTRQGFGPSMLVRYREMTDTADVVLVIAGHNDASMAKDNPDSLLLVRQAIDSLCRCLRAKYPHAAIGFVTPWAVERPGFAQVVQMLRQACAEHGFPLLDATLTSGIRPMDEDFRRRYFQGPNDQAHLNAQGHALLLDWGETFVRQLLEQPSDKPKAGRKTKKAHRRKRKN